MALGANCVYLIIMIIFFDIFATAHIVSKCFVLYKKAIFSMYTMYVCMYMYILYNRSYVGVCVCMPCDHTV
jgi:hypothetical protein